MLNIRSVRKVTELIQLALGAPGNPTYCVRHSGQD